MISRFFKAIDLYGKLPQGLAEATSSGAIVSVITMGFLGLMLITELIAYVTINVTSDMIVDEDRQLDKIHVNIDILFPKLPCEFLDVDAYDSMGQIVKDDQKFLKFFRLSEKQMVLEQYVNKGFNLDEARKSIDNRYGCEVSGYLKVNKVSGKVTFGAHRSHHQVQIVQKGLVLDMSHIFSHVSFGDDADLQKVQNQFKQGQLSSLDGQKRLKGEEFRSTPIQHEHFISIVPTTYTLLNKKQYSVYQYTANHNEIRAQYYPQMILRYDISPVTFKFWQTKEDILHFLVQICAIIGGVFTVSSMIESGVYKIMSSIKKD